MANQIMNGQRNMLLPCIKTTIADESRKLKLLAKGMDELFVLTSTQQVNNCLLNDI